MVERMYSTPTGDTFVDSYTHGPHEIDVLITGVGMVATAAWCSRTLSRALLRSGAEHRRLRQLRLVHRARHGGARRVRPPRRARRRGRRRVSHARRSAAVGRVRVREPRSAVEPRARAAARGHRHHRQHRARQRAHHRRRHRAVQPAGREHGGRGVHVRLPDSQDPVRAGARGLEPGRAQEPGIVEAGRGDSQPQRRDACASSTTHEAHARLLAVPERLLHVRRDREPADRSRRAGVRRRGSPTSRRSTRRRSRARPTSPS